MYNGLKRFFTTFDGVVACILLCVLTTILFVEVVTRYLFGSSSALGSEIAGQSFIWFIYLSISFMTGKRSHIVINIGDMIFPKSWQKYITLLSDAIFLAFSAIMFYYGLLLVLSTFEYAFTLSISGISMGVPYSIIPIAFGIMTVRLALFVYGDFIAIVKPETDEGGSNA